ncbi:MAG: hypothetical protein J6T84_01355 [Spirochaetaceae bacterium]|nr:hypothetical protein [Spirochaetaceae bacterium]
MELEYIKSKIKKICISPYFIIMVVYFVCHWFMLILTGYVWDDVYFASSTANYDTLKEISMMQGRPLFYLFLLFARSTPFRLFVFLLYAIQAILFYKILSKLNLLESNETLWLTLVYVTIPVYDARVLLTYFSSNVGITLFFIATYLYLSFFMISNSKIKNIFIKRLGVIILFLFSFILNSLLFFYYIIFLLMFILKLKNKGTFQLKLLFKEIIHIIFVNLDFLILPLIFFMIKSYCFPVYGLYASYNTVNVPKLLFAVKNTLLLVPKTICEVFINYSTFINSTEKVIILIIFCSAFYNIIPIKNDNTKHSIAFRIFILCLSLVLLYFAIFPYAAIGRPKMYTTGTDGRGDPILLPFGIILFIYAILNFYSFKVKRIMYIFFIIFGIIHFNYWYVEYQKDYYNQLAFDDKINIQYIQNHQNFLVVNETKTKINGDRFYTFSNNASHVFGNECHLILSSVNDLGYLNKNFLQEKVDWAYGVSEINPDYLKLDGIIIFKSNISSMKTFKMKVKEFFFKSLFFDDIKSYGDLRLIPLSENDSNLILYEYNNGRIKNNEDLLKTIDNL